MQVGAPALAEAPGTSSAQQSSAKRGAGRRSEAGRNRKPLSTRRVYSPEPVPGWGGKAAAAAAATQPAAKPTASRAPPTPGLARGLAEPLRISVPLGVALARPPKYPRQAPPHLPRPALRSLYPREAGKRRRFCRSRSVPSPPPQPRRSLPPPPSQPRQPEPRKGWPPSQLAIRSSSAPSPLPTRPAPWGPKHRLPACLGCHAASQG